MAALKDITREAVLSAIAEYDQLGRDEFLRKYGFDRARQYFLVHNGKRYDSKAIVGAAHGFLPGRTALPAKEFSGGKARLVRLLTRLGFHVEEGDWEELLTDPSQAPQLNLPAGDPLSRADLAAEYRRLCGNVDIYWTRQDKARAERTSQDPIRSRAARAAVILRSQGRCENPVCNGDIEDVTDNGEPILEVDHLHDIAIHGPDADIPFLMIALCPNCHATRTRGRTREQLTKTLIAEAQRLHDWWMDQE